MASFLGNKQSVESYATEAVPQSLQSNDSPAAMRGKVKQVSIPSANGNQTASGKLRFVLPNNNDSITRRSMFLRARCSINYTATLAGCQTPSNSPFFKGPGVVRFTPGDGSNFILPEASAYTPSQSGNEWPQLGNAYSLIQCSTVYSGSTVIDRIDYLCDLMTGLILPHCTNPIWLFNDGQLLLGVISPPMRSTELTTGGFVYWDLAIPVIHSCFNSERDFPNYLLDSNNLLAIDIDLTSLNRALYFGSSALNNLTTLNYNISNAQLCYESIELPREYIEAQRLATKKIPFVFSQLSYLINQMPMSAAVNYNVALNMSSLRAAYILPLNDSKYSHIYPGNTTNFAYIRNAGDVPYQGAGDYVGTNVQLFIDNQVVNKINLDNPTMTFVALKQALRNTITDYTTPSYCGITMYKAAFFAIGIDTTNFSDGSTMMGGTPVNQAHIVLTNFITNATTGTYLTNVIFAYDSLLIFKNGKITVKR